VFQLSHWSTATNGTWTASAGRCLVTAIVTLVGDPDSVTVKFACPDWPATVMVAFMTSPKRSSRSPFPTPVVATVAVR
jgi:hypothetical protein